MQPVRGNGIADIGRCLGRCAQNTQHHRQKKAKQKLKNQENVQNMLKLEITESAYAVLESDALAFLEEMNKLDSMIETTFIPLLKNCKRIITNGDGEALASKHSRKLLKRAIEVYKTYKRRN